MRVRYNYLIFITGFAAAVGQVLILRELLVLFHGNELSTGLVLACWLLWTALGSALCGRAGGKGRFGPAVLVAGVCLLCVVVPATLLWAREARVVWSVPAGELISAGRMFLIALGATAPFCFLSGAMFALAWSLAADSAKGPGGGTGIYLAEAAGSAVGGLVYYFLLLPRFSNFAGSLVLCAVLAVAAFAVAAGGAFRGRGPALCLSLAVAGLATGLFAYSGQIDHAARRAQWGPAFIDSRDTAYHNLCLLRNSGQYSLFCNGLWLYSTPDPQTEEPAAILPLLQHPKPGKVLLLGDFSPGFLQNVLRYPGVDRVDHVQQDREQAWFSARTAAGGRPAGNPRLHTHFTDPKRFLAAGAGGYGVIIMGAGEPVNAEMNRFYTVEFFSRIKAALAPGGVFSFALPSAPDIIGPLEARLLGAVRATLGRVFESVLVVTGEGAHFFAGAAGAVVQDPSVLADRMRAQKLDLQYLRDFHLFDWFNPFRIQYMDAVLGADSPAPVNRDFDPVCYLYALGLWGAQLHPAVGALLGALPSGERAWFPAALAVLVLAAGLAFRAGAGRAGTVTFNTAVCGSVLIVLEIVLILAYQIVNGSMYREMALILSLFMAGMAVGAGMGRKLGARSEKPVVLLVFSQLILAACAGGLALVLAGGFAAETMPAAVSGALFGLAALVAGVSGGGQFSLAVRAKAWITGSQAEGPGLYAADLAGAAAGAVLGSLFLIPVFGVVRTLAMLALSGLAASVALALPGRAAN